MAFINHPSMDNRTLDDLKLGVRTVVFRNQNGDKIVAFSHLTADIYYLPSWYLYGFRVKSLKPVANCY